jgi:methylmalonyl-CoA mutase
MTSESQKLADLFPAATEADWRGLVDKILKGADFDRRLVTRTLDGLAIKPLYTRADARPEADAVTRGAGAAPAAAATPAGWDIRQLHADPDPAAANAAILDDLTGGATSLTLVIAAPGWFGLRAHEADLARALRGVMLDVCPIHLRAGEVTPDAAGALMALWRKAGIADAKRRGGFNYDPLGTLAMTGALHHPVPKALEIAAHLVRDTLAMPNVTALLAHGHVYHAAGASTTQELAAILAAIVAYLRAAEAAGIAPRDALPKIAVAVAVDTEQFLSIAKLRAARRLIARIAEACGAPDAASKVRVAAETSATMMSRRDPWTNLLRTAIACSAAAMGGADAITVLPFTWLRGKPDAFARRIARNTHIVLQEESALGRVADPAGGSWYVESLTHDLAAKAWEKFQTIEANGGLPAALSSGALQDEIAATAAAKAELIATGRQEITGVSAYPRLGDDGITVESWRAEPLSADLKGARIRPLGHFFPAAPFEALRDAADKANFGKVFLASLGDLAGHAARSTWIRNFLAAGGIDVIATEGFTDSKDLGTAFAESGATVACLCGPDDEYAALGEAAAGILKQAGAKRVYLAGRPKAQEADLKAAGVDAFIYAGCNMPSVLRDVQAALGPEL